MNELSPTDRAAGPYRVLARKYRPATFSALIGQDALVRTLTNAIRSGRIAHAFMLTGVRGIGKTTTARIIARALNCVGPDGKGGPTAEPCGICQHCVAVSQDRHVDVIEIDAASHTKVDETKEMLAGVPYRPLDARYKIYIVDEVHMLSGHSFNALLKTLEEPPEHVKFVLATTEIRKVPVTVLSRCQRFDLRRLDRDVLARHLRFIAGLEQAAIEDDAIALLARAADGSVRDGLSLLDRAIAESNRRAPISAEQVRGMLGLADRAQILDLFEHIAKGSIAEALALARDLYRSGAEALVLVQDLLDTVHEITRLKLVPGIADADLSVSERGRMTVFAEKLPVGALSRFWQMLLKGIGEVQMAPQPLAALEMLLVRLCYAADLPTPGEIVRDLQSGAPRPAPPAQRLEGPAPTGSRAASVAGAPIATARARPEPQAQSSPEAPPRPQSFAEAVALFAANREMLLHTHLRADARLVRFEPGRLEIRLGERAPVNLANRVGELLSHWTGRRWIVAVSGEPGETTLQQQAERDRNDAFLRARENPIVRATLELFPGARITAVRRIDAEMPPAAAPGADEDDFIPVTEDQEFA